MEQLEQIIACLSSQGELRQQLFTRAAAIKTANIGPGIYLRGLIEYSNVCRKNCLYCGIRRDMPCHRYTLTEEQVLAAACFAYEQNYGSVVLQGGENNSDNHAVTIERLIREIKKLSNDELGITLSLGEQTLDTYLRWFEAGAHRYLLRIETSNPELYRRIHPCDSEHSFEVRLHALRDLRMAGYQVGTGVMIGLPGQTIEDLARDILFMRELDIDMCGMGPYVVTRGTPLGDEVLATGEIISEYDRLELTLNMIATLRVTMPDINIAATTALQAIDPMGRLRAIEAGANVIMPNMTPNEMRQNYLLYDGKPLSFDSSILENRVCYGQWGDSRHFAKRQKSE